jgi:hypothetical protein
MGMPVMASRRRKNQSDGSDVAPETEAEITEVETDDAEGEEPAPQDTIFCALTGEAKPDKAEGRAGGAGEASDHNVGIQDHTRRHDVVYDISPFVSSTSALRHIPSNGRLGLKSQARQSPLRAR